MRIVVAGNFLPDLTWFDQVADNDNLHRAHAPELRKSIWRQIVESAGFNSREAIAPCLLLGLGNKHLEMPVAERIPHIAAAASAHGSDSAWNSKVDACNTSPDTLSSTTLAEVPTDDSGKSVGVTAARNAAAAGSGGAADAALAHSAPSGGSNVAGVHDHATPAGGSASTRADAPNVGSGKPAALSTDDAAASDSSSAVAPKSAAGGARVASAAVLARQSGVVPSSGSGVAAARDLAAPVGASAPNPLAVRGAAATLHRHAAPVAAQLSHGTGKPATAVGSKATGALSHVGGSAKVAAGARVQTAGTSAGGAEGSTPHVDGTAPHVPADARVQTAGASASGADGSTPHVDVIASPAKDPSHLVVASSAQLNTAAAAAQMTFNMQYEGCKQAARAVKRVADDEQKKAKDAAAPASRPEQQLEISDPAVDLPRLTPSLNIFSYDQDYRTLVLCANPAHRNARSEARACTGTAPCSGPLVTGMLPSFWGALCYDADLTTAVPAPGRWQNVNYIISQFMMLAPVIYFDLTLLVKTLPITLAMVRLRLAMAAAIFSDELAPIPAAPLVHSTRLQVDSDAQRQALQAAKRRMESGPKAFFKDADIRKALVSGDVGDAATDWELLTIASHKQLWSKTVWCICMVPDGAGGCVEKNVANAASPPTGSSTGAGSGADTPRGLGAEHPKFNRRKAELSGGTPAQGTTLFECPTQWQRRPPWEFLDELMAFDSKAPALPAKRSSGSTELRPKPELPAACGPVDVTVRWWEEYGELGAVSSEPRYTEPQPADLEDINRLAEQTSEKIVKRRRLRSRGNPARTEAARSVAHAIYLADQASAVDTLHELDSWYAGSPPAGAGAGAVGNSRPASAGTTGAARRPSVSSSGSGTGSGSATGTSGSTSHSSGSIAAGTESAAGGASSS